MAKHDIEHDIVDSTPLNDYHSMSRDEVFHALKTSEKGLTEKEAMRRIKLKGSNQLEKQKGCAGIKIFLSQFKNFLIGFLIAAIIISLLLREYVDAIAMTAILLLSTLMGFVQEYRAERAMQALEKMTAPHARVIRNGVTKKVPASRLVPGDIIVMEAGDIIPADIRILESYSMKILESSLTGESEPVTKHYDTLQKMTPVVEQKNMAFMSCQIVNGTGTGVVVETGMSTQIGRIATTLQKTVTEQTPLQKKFASMGKQLGIGVMILVLIVFITGVMQNIGAQEPSDLIGHMLIFALSLAVATVPSSLPAIVTIGLSLGARNLAKNNMIMKRLPAAESLGAVTIICSDKTGTLTKNEMTVTDIYVNNKHISVTGTGYDAQGEFYHDGRRMGNAHMEKLALIGTLCNNSCINYERHSIEGDPTEAALLVLGKKNSTTTDGYLRIGEIPFDSERKMMSTIYKTPSKKHEAYVKGAPDILIKKCTRILIAGKVVRMTEKNKKKILKQNDVFAEGALRVLGAAYREVEMENKYDSSYTEKNLIFVGLFAMMDPPRAEAAKAIEECKKAGIRVMMITGDHAMTARAIAQKLSLLEKKDIILTGEDIDNMTDQELYKSIDKIRIIARALPIQKSRIVRALQHNKHVVAMTGDGVNDAPALKKADIGIAMGISGTDVAKEVSGGILLDDNFATIVKGVREGRNIFDKVIKTTRYLISCNVGEITLIFLAIMLRLPLPLLPLQLLLMNLITDGLPGLALAAEPEDRDIMKKPPRNPKEKPLTPQTIMMILLFGLTMGIGTLIMYYYFLSTTASVQYAMTIAFTTLVMFEMFAVFGARSLKPFQKLNPLSNPWIVLAVATSVSLHLLVVYLPVLQNVFGTVSIEAIHWIPIIMAAMLGFLMSEVGKLLIRDEHVIRQKV
jgi:P-type Ca2+ transporter type 2C